MPSDPYRTLGLPRAASMDEVKRAYRRLAKANHPDRAGEGSLPRFLEIQAAYDRIAAGDTAGGGAAPGAWAASGPRRPWDADPTRADATRRAYGSRTRRPGGTGPRADGPGAGASSDRGAAGGSGAAGAAAAGPGASGPGASSADPSRAPGAGGRSGRSTWDEPSGARAGPADPGPDPGSGTADADAGAGEGGSPRSRGGRIRNKATLGSTSYDGVDGQPFEPDWGGASWYGTTTGTYWTLNPKEYADPRKHGPEYQARARRRGRAADPAAGDGPGVADETDARRGPTADRGPRAQSARAGATGEDAPRATPPPTHTTTSWWDATSADGGAGGPADDTRPGDPGGVPTRGGRRPPPPPSSARPARPTPLAAEPLVPAFDPARWLEVGRGGVAVRVGRAVLGWAPIALGIGWLAGEMTGCGRYSATCDAAAAPVAWFAQVAVLALLLLVPRLAVAATIATISILAVAIPGALLLSATGTDARDTLAPPTLGGLLVIGWAVGLAAGLWREVRALRTELVGGDGSRQGRNTDAPTADASTDGPTDEGRPVS